MNIFLFCNKFRCIHFGKVKQEAGKNNIIITTQTSMILNVEMENTIIILINIKQSQKYKNICMYNYIIMHKYNIHIMYKEKITKLV